MMKSTLFISNIMSIDTIKQITQDILKPYKDVSCYLFGSLRHHHISQPVQVLAVHLAS